MIYEHIPFLSKVVELIIRIRTFVTFVVLTVFWDLVYRFLPNRRNMANTTLRKQLSRERRIRHADVAAFVRTFFRYTLMCLKALQVCTEV